VQFLICRQCGTVAEIENRAAAQALEDAAERKGFHAHHTIVEIEGTCAACFHPA
jgi:Fur family zinc uptake transcriptional regulator